MPAEPSQRDLAAVSEIAAKFLGEPVRSARPIGNGSNNKNFLVEVTMGRVVVKLSHEHKKHRALHDYQKEQWCLEQSSVLGVPGPSALAVGAIGDNAYMIETFVEGVNGKEVAGDRTAVWRKLGEYAKLIHSIKVSGWSEKFFDDTPTGHQGSWLEFVTYNIESLTDDDPLIGLGVIDRNQSRRVREIFMGLKANSFRFGLNHGDLSIWNTLIGPSGRVNLLDWGSAEVHIVPHFDLLHILGCQLKDGTPTRQEMAAFLQGYGLSDEKYQRMQPELKYLLLLKSFDKLRWAIEKNPPKVAEFVERAKRTATLFLGQS